MGNALGGQMNAGDVITGSYTFDTSTADMDPSVEFGNYPHAAGMGSMSLTINGLTLASDPNAPDNSYIIDIGNFSSGDLYHVVSFKNQPLPTGASLQHLSLDIFDPSGTAQSTDNLTNTAPDLSLYDIHDLNGNGTTASGGDYFNFSAKITSLAVNANTPNGSYQVSAIVRDIYDPYNALQGKINIGDAVSGSYAVDLAANDIDPNTNHAHYMIPADSKYGFDLNINSINFKSDSLQNMSEIHIQNDFSDQYHVIGRPGSVSGLDAYLDEIGIFLFDSYGQALSSTAQPAGDIDVSTFDIKDLAFFGSTVTGQYFQIIAELTSITTGTDTTPDFTVSPATDSTFIFWQRFDMGILLPPTGASMPLAVRGNINGIPHPYFSSSLCSFGPMTMTNQPTYICADTHQVLMPGTNIIDLFIDISDGSTLTAQVKWTLLD